MLTSTCVEGEGISNKKYDSRPTICGRTFKCHGGASVLAWYKQSFLRNDNASGTLTSFSTWTAPPGAAGAQRNGSIWLPRGPESAPQSRKPTAPMLAVSAGGLFHSGGNPYPCNAMWPAGMHMHFAASVFSLASGTDDGTFFMETRSRPA